MWCVCKILTNNPELQSPFEKGLVDIAENAGYDL